MLLKDKKRITIITIAIALTAVFICNISTTLAVDAAKNGLNQSAGQAFLDGTPVNPDGENPGVIISLPGAIGTVIGALLSFIGIVFMILMIYGGVLWMTARGNESQVKEAKDLITAAIVGLVIVLSAYGITAFMGNILTSTS